MNKEQPFFSIIIPMYNVAEYIERALQSVFSQSFSPSKYEVIIIDDGSPDNSRQIAERFCLGKENVKIISQENKGLGGARNSGINAATGQYILFLDADDWLTDNALNNLKENIINEDIAEFSVRLYYNKKRCDQILFDVAQSLSGIEYYFKHNTINSACNKIYRRQFLLKHNLRFLERIYGEDIHFNTLALFYAKKIKSISAIYEVFYQSHNSITRNKDFNKKLKYLQDRKKVILDLAAISKNFSDPSHLNYFYDRIATIIVNAVFFSFKNKIGNDFIYNFITDLRRENVFKIDKPIKHKNFYRKLLVSKGSLMLLFFINSIRGRNSFNLSK